MSVELKIKKYSAADIARITGGRLEIYGGDATLPQRFVAIDSREGGEGVIFCAIEGEKANGNDYIPGAAKMGSRVFICQYVPDEAREMGICAVIVDDTVEALGALASDYRMSSKARFIGVTGSVGKTTTKEFISSVASACFRTHKTSGNYNSLIGLPLSIFGIEPDDEVVVLEMGMSNLGEIERMSKIARPDIGVITVIGTSHLESLGTRENICRAKLEIRAGLSRNGVLVLNGDDPYLMAEMPNIQNRIKTYALQSPKADFRAMNARQKDGTTVFDLIHDGMAVTNVEIPVLGRHNVGNALAAYTVGIILGMKDEQIRRGLMTFVNVDKRQKVYDVNNITVIDDCYNASPESMRAAIDVLSGLAAKKKARPCALLGDMLELGDNSRMMHYEVGQYAAQMQVQKLFCYGTMAETIAEAAIRNGIRAENVHVCADTGKPEVMAQMIMKTLSEGDLLLVKASRGIAAERVIECMRK